jgi:subtilisin family serine protease
MKLIYGIAKHWRATSLRGRALTVAAVVVALAAAAVPFALLEAPDERASAPLAEEALDSLTSERLGSGSDQSASSLAGLPIGPGRRAGDEHLEGRTAVPRRLLVRFDPDASLDARGELLASIGVRFAGEPVINDTHAIDIARGGRLEHAMTALRRSPLVLYAERDLVYRASVAPNDPRFASLWGLHNVGQISAGVADADIDAPEAWEVTTGDNAVTVGVVDTGVAYEHPDLAPNIWRNPGESGAGRESNGVDDDGNGYVDDVRGWDWVDDDASPHDLNGHGTHVAGTIGAQGNDGVGVTGVSWKTSLVPLRALDASGAGTSSDLARAFNYAGKKGLSVVSASLGGGGFSQTLLDSIAAWPKTLFVVAAGNEAIDNEQRASYPCNYTVANLVCVAATDAADRLAGFSNYGSTSVDLGAPGVGILSTVPSFVTPFTEGFEAELAVGWVSGGTAPAWGRSSDSYGFFASDSPTGQYGPNVDSHITTATPIDLSDGLGCTLGYALKLDAQQGKDGVVVEASSDGTRFTQVSARSGSTSGAWASIEDDLSDVSGTKAWLRFRFVSDGTIEREGVEIDDLTIKCAAGSYDGSQYASFSGTSMATPHVAGAAALLRAAAPSASALAIKDALMQGGDAIPALAGKTLSGKRLNLVGGLRALGVAVTPSMVSSPSTSVSSPGPAASPTSTGTPVTQETASPETSPEATPSDEAAPSPNAEPSTGDEEPSGEMTSYSRSVTLMLRRHLVARGSVGSEDGDTRCVAGVVVEVQRNGRRIARSRTDDSGDFLLRLADRTGRYRVIVRAAESDGGECLASSSVVRRHRH